ncbi:MAG: hypothetical protein ACYC48_00040 [Minisyncoccota bacterium]
MTMYKVLVGPKEALRTRNLIEACRLSVCEIATAHDPDEVKVEAMIDGVCRTMKRDAILTVLRFVRILNAKGDLKNPWFPPFLSEEYAERLFLTRSEILQREN